MKKTKFSLKNIRKYLHTTLKEPYYFYAISKKKTFNLILKKIQVLYTYTIPSIFTDLFYSFTASKRKTPDFIVIGVHKGGTTSIYDYLNQHPEIKMSRRKEINFFSKYYFMGINYYRSFFPKKSVDKITGEVSPYYFFHPHAARRIKETFPNIKIILLLRNPVERAYSHFNMVRGIDPADSFSEAINLENERTNLEEKKVIEEEDYHSVAYQSFSYINHGLYYKQLSNWSKHFNIEEMLILKSEDFFENTETELKKVYNYLNVSKIFPKDLLPKNARSYNKISTSEYQKYYPYFKEDQLKLKELLGNKFFWG